MEDRIRKVAKEEAQKALRLTEKERAINLIEELNCSYEFRRADYPRRGTEIEVFAPEGYLFDGELSSLVCRSWKDVLTRLPQYKLVKEKQLRCKYCGEPVPKGAVPEVWARYHIGYGHKDKVKELAEKKLPWSAGLILE